MKNCTSRNYLYQVMVTAAVALAQPGITHAQTASLQTSVARVSSGTDEQLIATELASSSTSADALPEAPIPQGIVPEQGQQAPPPDQTHINSIPLLSPRLRAGTVLTAHDKWEIYYHKTYSPAAMIYPLIGAGIQMANPKKGYPEEWQDGAGAFGRIYGNSIAQRTARSTADFGTQVLLHEDPRYQRSDSKNPVFRISHALAWTFVDSSDSGRRMFAVSTFTSAAAGGFVGMAYLPDGYNDVTHAEQRMVMGIGGRAISNVLTEFEPVWGPWAAKLRIPQLLPAWWVRQPRP